MMKRKFGTEKRQNGSEIVVRHFPHVCQIGNGVLKILTWERRGTRPFSAYFAKYFKIILIKIK